MILQKLNVIYMKIFMMKKKLVPNRSGQLNPLKATGETQQSGKW